MGADDDPNTIADNDYHLTADSDCIDRGVAVCPARAGWGGRYDIGCYEYDSRAGGTGVSLAYDAAGNLTNDGDKLYEYDVLGRLTRVGIMCAWERDMPPVRPSAGR